MARKTDGERIDDLQHRVAELAHADVAHNERAVYTVKSLDEARTKIQKVEEQVREAEKRLTELQLATESQIAALRLEYEKQLADLRRAHEAETKLLKQQVEELKQEQLRWGARLWQVAVGLGVLVIGAALTTYLGIKK